MTAQPPPVGNSTSINIVKACANQHCHGHWSSPKHPKVNQTVLWFTYDKMQQVNSQSLLHEGFVPLDLLPLWVVRYSPVDLHTHFIAIFKLVLTLYFSYTFFKDICKLVGNAYDKREIAYDFEIASSTLNLLHFLHFTD